MCASQLRTPSGLRFFLKKGCLAVLAVQLSLLHGALVYFVHFTLEERSDE